jgi:hypothetical protein
VFLTADSHGFTQILTEKFDANLFKSACNCVNKSEEREGRGQGRPNLLQFHAQFASFRDECNPVFHFPRFSARRGARGDKAGTFSQRA